MCSPRFLMALLLFTGVLSRPTISPAGAASAPPPGTYQLQQDLLNLTGRPQIAQILDFGQQPDALRYVSSSRHGYYTVHPLGNATRLNMVFDAPLSSLPDANRLTLALRTAGSALTLGTWGWWENGTSISVPALSGSVRARSSGSSGWVDSVTWTLFNRTAKAFVLNKLGFGTSDNQLVLIRNRVTSGGAVTADPSFTGSVLMPPGGVAAYDLQLTQPYQPGLGSVLDAVGTLSDTGASLPALLAPLTPDAQFSFEHQVAAPGFDEIPALGLGGAPVTGTGQGQAQVPTQKPVTTPTTGPAGISGRYLYQSGAPVKDTVVVLKQVDVLPNIQVAQVKTDSNGAFSFAIPALGHRYGIEAMPQQNIIRNVGARPGVAGVYMDAYNLHILTRPDITSYPGFLFIAARIG